MSLQTDTERPKANSPQSLSGLRPFIDPYRWQVALAVLFLRRRYSGHPRLPGGLRQLIDGGLLSGDRGTQAAKLRGHFLTLFGVAFCTRYLLSGALLHMVSWLGERVTTDLRNAVYSHVLRQSPAFFEATQTGEVLSRLTTDTTLVQTVVGSSLSMGLRNGVMGLGALIMLVWTNPYVMTQVLLILLLRSCPAWFGPPRANYRVPARQGGRRQRRGRRSAQRHSGGAKLHRRRP
ncbi:MAG: ABC transporter transmembrane domain-containing protein [Burkholderiaceae bacterium]